MKQLIVTVLMWAASGLALAALPDLTLYVSPNGNDDWSGRRSSAAQGDGPFRTLPAVQSAARAALAERRAAGGGNVRVILLPGFYALDRPLTFEPADSGFAGAPMVYQAAEPGTVTISGGLPLTALPKPVSPGELGFSAAGIDPAFWIGAPQLYVNGRRAVLAREPDEGADWFVGQPVAVPGEQARIPGLPVHSLGRVAFRPSDEALAFAKRLDTQDRHRAVLHLMQSWSSERHRLAADAPAGTLRISRPTRWPLLHFGASQRFHIENVVSGLDQPGEWVGTAERIRYLPRRDEPDATEAVLARLEHVIVVRGAGPAGPYVQHLEFRDLSIEHGLAPTPKTGWIDRQAASEVAAAVQVDFARGVALRGCRIANTGGYAVWLRDGVRDSSIVGSTMHDLGAGGVKVGSQAAGRDDDRSTGANLVTENRIARTGQIYPGAVGIWVGASFDNVLSHNTVTDTTYSGISVGWQWDYGPPGSGRNRVVANALLDIGSGEMADLGAIYTLGPAPGTVVADNFIANVRGYPAYGAGAYGIYNDQASSGLRIENNVVVGTDSGGYHVNWGRNLLVQHNLFAGGGGPEVSLLKSDPGRTKLVLRGNLFAPGVAKPFSTLSKSPDAEYVDNLVARRRPDQALDLNACAGGCEAVGALVSIGPRPQDLRLGGVDPERAKRWTETAARAGAPEDTGKSFAARSGPVTSRAAGSGQPPAPRLAPPRQVASILDAVPAGAQPPGWRYLPEGPGPAIAVVEDTRSPHRSCLQLLDSASLDRPFEPHLYTLLNHVSGTSVASFAVRVDDRFDLVTEWRDDGDPYRVGPSVRISPRGVEAAGRLVAPPIAAGAWRQLRISAPVAGGVWLLEVRDPDGSVHSADGLPPRHADWHGLKWLGFMSNATTDAVACIDGLEVSNTPR